MCQRPIPARFKLACHQPVGGIGGIILPEGTVDGITRRFEIAAEGLAHLIPPFSGFLGRGRCSGDGARTNDVKKSFFDRIVDAQSTKGDAVRPTIVHPGAAAAVARDAMNSAWIGEHHFNSLGVLSCPDLVLAYIAARTKHIRLDRKSVV